LIEEKKDALYSCGKPEYREAEITAIPYALWQNRGDAEMELFFPLIR